jgi:hypothetical protein
MLLQRLSPLGFGATRHLVHFYARAPIGASGAVTTASIAGRGLTIAKSATGTYTATIKNQTGVGAILYADCKVLSATKQHAACTGAVASTGIVTFVTSLASALNTAADPGNGDELLIHIVVRNSPSDAS